MIMYSDSQMKLNMDGFGVDSKIISLLFFKKKEEKGGYIYIYIYIFFFFSFQITGNTRGIRCNIVIRGYFGYYYRLLIIIFIVVSRLLVGVPIRVITCVPRYAAPCRRISDTKC